MMKHKIFLAIVFMLVATIVWADEKQQVQHLIKTQADFDKFVKAVNDGKTYENEVVLLLTDVKLFDIIGRTTLSPFSGTFDGCGHTITVNIKGGAPIRHAANATFANLQIRGKVNGPNYSSGFISTLGGDHNTIINCRVSTVVTCTNSSGNPNGGGFFSLISGGNVLIKGCQFDGKIIADKNIQT